MPAAELLMAEAPGWRSLADRAIEPNPFAGPDVLLPGLQHLKGGRSINLVHVWRGDRLVALVPLAPSRALARGAVRLWRPALVPAGAPLVDADHAGEAVGALLDWLAAQDRPATLEFDGLVPDGPLSRAIEAVALRTGRGVETSIASRPTDQTASEGGEGGGAVIPAFALTSARDPSEIRDAVERFLVLEAATSDAAALIRSVGQASFIRTATRNLARSGLCRVDLVHAAGELRAAAIVVTGDGVAFPWLHTGDQRLLDLARVRPTGRAGREGRRMRLAREDAPVRVAPATSRLVIAVRSKGSPEAVRACP